MEQVSVLFEKELEVQGLPVVDKEKPVGLLMKHTFYRHLGKQYGYPIFMKRSIEQLMDKNPLLVDCGIPLDRVSEIAMTRNTDALYDYIIVTKDGKYQGIVTIKDLLQKTTEIQLERPLTGLPGNIMIEQKVSDVIFLGKEYAVLYFDLEILNPTMMSMDLQMEIELLR